MTQPPLLTLFHLNLTAARNGQGRGGLGEGNLLQQRWRLIGGDWTSVVRGKKLRNKNALSRVPFLMVHGETSGSICRLYRVDLRGPGPLGFWLVTPGLM